MPRLPFAEAYELAIEDLWVDASLLFDEDDLRSLRHARLCAYAMGLEDQVSTFRDAPDPYAPTHWVYAIYNPDGAPFYVGMTTCLERRWQQHRSSVSQLPKLAVRLADPSDHPVDTAMMFRRIKRIAKYLSEGIGPSFGTLGEAWSRKEALALETTWAHRMTAKGYELLNPGEHRVIKKYYRSHRRYELKYHRDAAPVGTR